jgi:hypothetical protein
VEKLSALGPGIFLDLKFHDIPNTVRGAVASAIGLPGVQLMDLHALGGLEMMRAAAKARDEAGGSHRTTPKLLAITVLTSMNNSALRAVGIARSSVGPPCSEGRHGRRCGVPSRNPRDSACLREGLPDCGSWNPPCSRGRSGWQAEGEDGRSGACRYTWGGHSFRGGLPGNRQADYRCSRPGSGNAGNPRRNQFSAPAKLNREFPRGQIPPGHATSRVLNSDLRQPGRERAIIRPLSHALYPSTRRKATQKAGTLWESSAHFIG